MGDTFAARGSRSLNRKQSIDVAIAHRVVGEGERAGALGAALLSTVLKRKWLTQELDSRALRLTNIGRRELKSRFGIET